MAYRYIDLSLFSIFVFVYGSQTYDPLPSIEHTPPPPQKKSSLIIFIGYLEFGSVMFDVIWRE